jgi:hypothetical protein
MAGAYFTGAPPPSCFMTSDLRPPWRAVALA